ncbi:hypothetical protein RQN9TF_31630 (plasmid) [Rhodococcus qingshengii]|nr:hypothetical protein RQN9TF_31630 [Rhodococcus qingshengii]
MTTLENVTKKRAEPSAEAAAAAELVRLAKEQGLSLTGPDGLLKQFTKTVLETALNEEMTEHLGHDKNQAPADRESTNIRNGTRSKTVLTEASGHVPIEVPRDREGTFEPQIVKKRQRRLNGVDEIVLSLYAKGLTTGEISSHFAEIYGASVGYELDFPRHPAYGCNEDGERSTFNSARGSDRPATPPLVGHRDLPATSDRGHARQVAGAFQQVSSGADLHSWVSRRGRAGGVRWLRYR